jgi:hypothetical protein
MHSIAINTSSIFLRLLSSSNLLLRYCPNVAIAFVSLPISLLTILITGAYSLAASTSTKCLAFLLLLETVAATLSVVRKLAIL